MTSLRRETLGLFNFFQSKVGDIVDLNLDNFPEYIVATFVSHQDVLSALRKAHDTELWTYPLEAGAAHPESSKKHWTFEPSKIDFICHVRNCDLADDMPPSKYLPIYAHIEKLAKARAMME